MRMLHWLGGNSGLRALLVIAISAQTVDAQDARFEVLTIPPANVGSCMPPQVRPDTAGRIRQGNRLVIKSVPSGSSRDISTMTDATGTPTGLSDRSNVINASLGGKGAAIVATVRSNGSITGFRIDMTHTVPDSVMQNPATMLNTYSSTGTSATRALDSTEQSRVRSLIEFMQRRCP